MGRWADGEAAQPLVEVLRAGQRTHAGAHALLVGDHPHHDVVREPQALVHEERQVLERLHGVGLIRECGGLRIDAHGQDRVLGAALQLAFEQRDDPVRVPLAPLAQLLDGLVDARLVRAVEAHHPVVGRERFGVAAPRRQQREQEEDG
jgi:hypothetical protein